MQVISIADDGKILRWNLVSSETKEMAELASDFHPTDMHWYPRSSGGGGGPSGPKKGGQVSGASGGGVNDIFVVGSAEGKLQLMSGKNGRIEKSVDAHRGACLCVK